MENEYQCHIPIACSVDTEGQWLHQALIKIKDNSSSESKEMIALARLAKFRFDMQNKSKEEIDKKIY